MTADRQAPTGPGVSHLVRRFVCGRCGATAPLSTRPYQECGSCNAVSDYDFGVARQHPDGPTHEALAAHLFAVHEDELGAASAAFDRGAYTSIYEGIIGTLIDQVPSFYPTRAKEPAYRACLARFHAGWQAEGAINQRLLYRDVELVKLRSSVAVTDGRADPATLWPLIDHALDQFDATQDAVDREVPPPPEDFVPKYIVRFEISSTVAEWLPKLDRAAQRELVERLGVSDEYVEPAQDTVTCPNCGGTVPVTPGFLTMPCPFCKAEIAEARAGYRGLESERAQYADYERSLAEAERRAKTPVVALRALDGQVVRDGKPYRMVTVRARFAQRDADVFETYDLDGAPHCEGILAWAGVCARARGVPLERVPYREHPRCNELPGDVAELARRLEETAPGAAVTSTDHYDGLVAEVVVDGTIVRLVDDDEGKRTKLLRRWLGHGA